MCSRPSPPLIMAVLELCKMHMQVFLGLINHLCSVVSFLPVMVSLDDVTRIVISYI